MSGAAAEVTDSSTEVTTSSTEASPAPALEPLRVLIASDFFHPFIGGAERQVELLGAELGRRGHRVAIATVWHAHLAEAESVDGLPVRRLRGLSTRVPWFSGDPGRRFHPPAPDPSLVVGLRRLVNELRPDIVHANGWIGYSCAAALAARDTPLVLSVRDYGYSCPVRTLLERGRRISDGPELAKCLRCATERYGPAKALAAVGGVFTTRPLLARRVDGIHSVSRFVESIVRRDLLGTRATSRLAPVLATIPDVVPASSTEASASTMTRTPAGAADAAALDALPSRPFALFVGALQAHKGIDVLLDAHRRMRMRPKPPLVLIGTRWPDSPQRFPSDVVVLEDVPHAVVMEAWRRSSFGVLPSVWPDPLPGTVREAMSAGRAVIATAVGGNLDMVVDGETGLLVRAGDPVALAAAMDRLAGDPGLCERLAAAASRSLAGLQAPPIAARFETFYGAVLERARRVRREAAAA